MNNNEMPDSYSRPTGPAIATQSFTLLWIIKIAIASVFISLCPFFMLIIAVLSLATSTVFSPDKMMLCILMMLCIFMPLTIGFFLFASLSSQMFRLAKELDQAGLITSGTVVELWQGDEDYYYAYQFTVSGNTFGAYNLINFPKERRLRVGDTITIRYLPTDPTKSRAEL